MTYEYLLSAIVDQICRHASTIPMDRVHAHDVFRSRVPPTTTLKEYCATGGGQRQFIIHFLPAIRTFSFTDTRYPLESQRLLFLLSTVVRRLLGICIAKG